MSTPESWSARRARWMNRLRARLSPLGRKATGFTSQPEPRTIGSFARGRQLCAGNFLFAGHLIEAPDTMIWDLAAPDQAFQNEIHGFAWLDDLAAVGDGPAQRRAQSWAHEWTARYGRGKGPGWAPDLTGRRLIRWINHAIFLLNGASSETSRAFFAALSHQTSFVAHRWHAAAPGLPRFEALAGLIYAALSLAGLSQNISRALRALDRECEVQIDREGGIPSRNPEELLEVFTLLTWTFEALTEAGHTPGPNHKAAIERIAPTLRALRHADGGLARFHGGGRGLEGRLDQALASSGVRRMRPNGLAMGFARLSHGRTSVIVDAALPPRMQHSLNGHASTLAFELTSGRRPIIVNCGSGATFGTSWRRAGRATPSHSTLAIEGYSSSRLGGTGFIAGQRTELLVDTPRDVQCREVGEENPTVTLVTSHDGYVHTHGLTHVRRLELSTDGRSLTGEDALSAIGKNAEKHFDQVFERTRLQGVPFQIRFHLHPDVNAQLDMGGNAVSLALKSGELWVFRHDGTAQLTLGPSVYLETGRLSPRATKQIVLSSAAMDYATRIGWIFAKAQETPAATRDFALEEDLAYD